MQVWGKGQGGRGRLRRDNTPVAGLYGLLHSSRQLLRPVRVALQRGAKYCTQLLLELSCQLIEPTFVQRGKGLYSTLSPDY